MMPLDRAEFNINAVCFVTLTEAGASIYNDYERQFVGKISAQYIRFYKAGEVLEKPMWGLFQIFGHSISMTMPEPPFKDNKIEISTKL